MGDKKLQNVITTTKAIEQSEKWMKSVEDSSVKNVNVTEEVCVFGIVLCIKMVK